MVGWTMKRHATWLALTLLVVNAGLVAQETGRREALKVGETAPDWEMLGSDGKTYRLSDYRGKQAVVVAWYPAALTGG